MSRLTVNIIKSGYSPETPTISNIQFTIEPEEIIGIIGSNGAGKTTTIKSILGVVPFMEGEIEGFENIRYSYIPERPVFYQDLTLWEHFEFVAAVEELNESKLSYAKELLERFLLIERIHEFPETFSKGMQQKAMLALAFFTKPNLLIIDEPFMGLDPGSTKLFLNMLEEIKSNGVGVLMCTHILDIAERICDSFIVIEKGTMKAKGKLNDVLAQCGAADNSLYSCISMEENNNE